VWFIRFFHTTKDLGDPGSSRGTLERIRVDLTLYIRIGIPLGLGRGRKVYFRESEKYSD
jgi:hypothetical protein